MKNLNLGEISVQGGVGGAGGDADSDEEDKDFVAEKDDAGLPKGDSDEESSDVSGQPAKELKEKEPAASNLVTKKKKREDREDDGKKKKRKKNKKDPNAPKGAMSSFMYFSQVERQRLKETNPELAFMDVGRGIGERWKKMTDEEKEPYAAQAKRDKTRYTTEMAEYRKEGASNRPLMVLSS